MATGQGKESAGDQARTAGTSRTLAAAVVETSAVEVESRNDVEVGTVVCMGCQQQAVFGGEVVAVYALGADGGEPRGYAHRHCLPAVLRAWGSFTTRPWKGGR